MLVRFMAQRAAKAEVQGIDALREDVEYVVLEVFAPHGKSALFRLEFTEGEDPALFDSRAFTVISSSIPPSWRYFQFESGSFALRPEPWGRPGFWEAYYDRDRRALETYESEKSRILASMEQR
ncbi:hypothetical protein ACIF83_03485 [Streptomyces sp. NPDC085866]|uniref:hypothetical protein n=1 Tax=Streptomyces sp. NPDC085866 TaxID=3365736 RepID=UPI0037D61F83